MSPPARTSTTDGLLTVEIENGAAWFAVDDVGGSTASFGIYAGDATGAIFDAAIHLSDQAVARSSAVTFFCDGLFMRRYDSAYREKWVRWFIAHRRRVTTLHFAAGKAPLLRMGLQMVNLAVPSLCKVYDSDEHLDGVLGAHRPAFLRLRAARDGWLARRPVV